MNFGFLPSDSASSLPSSSQGGKREGARESPSFERHLAGLQEQIREILKDIRSFVLALGPSVIEEARPHRIVYAKTLTFRTFLDIEPASDHLVVEIRTGRRNQQQQQLSSPPQSGRFIVRTQQDAQRVKDEIAKAYAEIR